MPMGYEQFKPPQNNLNALNSGRIKIESEDFLIYMYDVPGDGQCFFHALSLAITGNLSQSLVYRSLICYRYCYVHLFPVTKYSYCFAKF
jgi:hypothetical protein